MMAQTVSQAPQHFRNIRNILDSLAKKCCGCCGCCGTGPRVSQPSPALCAGLDSTMLRGCAGYSFYPSKRKENTRKKVYAEISATRQVAGLGCQLAPGLEKRVLPGPKRIRVAKPRFVASAEFFLWCNRVILHQAVQHHAAQLGELPIETLNLKGT